MAGRSENLLKRWGMFWLRRMAPKPGTPPTSRDLERVLRILVVRLDDRIGNAVLVTPLLVALKGRFSRATVAVLLARRHWDLRHYIPSVDEFIPFDRAALAVNPLRVWRLIRQLREKRFDLVFNAADDRTVSFNHLLVTALSGGRCRVGHAQSEAARFYEIPVPIPKPAPGGTTRHAAEMHLDLLRAVTPIRSHPRPLLKPPKIDTGFAERFCQQDGVDPLAPLVVIHPGGRGDKRWPAGDFASVARLLHERGRVNIALVWGPADDGAAREVLAAAGDAVIPAGILSYDDLISLVRHAAIFVSGDCGPMHLASAIGTPVVAVFLVSDADKYHPLGPNDTTLDDRQCHVTPNTVADAVVQALQRSTSTRPGGLAISTICANPNLAIRGRGLSDE